MRSSGNIFRVNSSIYYLFLKIMQEILFVRIIWNALVLGCREIEPKAADWEKK